MNIETLLQAAQILESQQSIPPKKRIAIADRQNSTTSTTTTTTTSTTANHVPTSVLSSMPINTNPTSTLALSSSSSFLKTEQNDDFPQRDLNLNVHHHNHLVQQRLTSTSNTHDDDEDDDDDDDMDETNNQNVDRTHSTSNRNSTTCFRDREIHNRLEKHRRAHLKDCFDSLKAEVPCQRDRKITNLQVLNLAIKYIQTLTRKERQYDEEMTVLTTHNHELQRRLNTLKSDLNSQGHQVDTWLDSCSIDVDYSVSTRTASEAEMYRTSDDHDDHDDYDGSTKKSVDLISNHQFPAVKTSSPTTYPIDAKVLVQNRKLSTRSRPRPAKRKLQSIPTTNLLQTLSSTTTSCPENILDFSVARHLHLDEPCNLLTNLHARTKESLSLTPITDIRYEIVDMFTKGTSSHSQHITTTAQQQQISPLPSIASLMNRHSSQPSPVVSPTKQTIGINTDPLTTSTTNILHQPVATS